MSFDIRRKLLVDNYSSSNKIQFQSHQGSYGNDSLPKDVHVVKSGFVRDVPQTLPPYHQVRSACYDMNYLLKEKQAPSYLFSLQNKDPIESENNYHGPGFMTTENHTWFVKQQNIDTSEKTFGLKQGSGFTHAYNNEPITYRPNECFDSKYPSWKTWRPTATSVMKMSFKTMENPKGKEAFNKLSKRAVRLASGSRDINVLPAYAVRPPETYTKINDVHSLTEKRIKKNDPAEYFNMCHVKQFPSMTQSTFQGLQPKEELFFNFLKNCDKKENTGYSQNNCKFNGNIETPVSLKRFVSHYKHRFHDKNPKSSANLTESDVLKQLSNGFTKSTAVNSYGSEKATNHELAELHPYIKKSIVARYPYTVHDSKYTRT